MTTKPIDARHGQRPRHAVLALACAVLPVLSPPAARAETNPYYLGVSQSVAYDSNLFRLGGGATLPTSTKSRSDTTLSTSLVAGIDQTWGRQRISGSGSLRSSRFVSNNQLNNNGYGLNLGLDWSTVQRVSGNVGLSASRSLRRFDPTEQAASNLGRNVEDDTGLNATVRVGVVTRLTAEATLNHNSVRFSAPAFSGSEYNQTGASLGLRYRLGGATQVGAAWRTARVRFANGNDPYQRRDIDLSANWDPSGLTSAYARISHSSTDHSQVTARNFSGVTGEVRASTQATGKIKLDARLSRDTGQSYSTFNFQGFGSAAEFNRTSTALHLGALYDFSAKIALTGGLDHVQRNLNSALTSSFALDGGDGTTTLSLGGRWQPTRAVSVGCDVLQEQRSVSPGTATVGRAYGSTGLSCFGQLVLQ